MWTVRELQLEDGSSPFGQWFASLKPDVASKIVVAQKRMEMGNISNIEWFRGIGEYKMDYGAGWRIYLAKDDLEIIVLLGGGSKKSQQRDITEALALWEDYKQRKKAATPTPSPSSTRSKR